MVWITWRQHRTALVGGLVVTAVLTGLLLWIWQGVAEINAACAALDCWIGAAGAMGDRASYTYTVLFLGQPVLGGLIAVFWAAPLLAREYEQRTYQLVWSQDVTPMRWLGGKVAVLGAAAVVLSAVLAAASWQLVEAMRTSPGGTFGMNDYRALEYWPPTQVLYTLFGFALGLAVGMATKRVVLAMGATLVTYAAVRLAIAGTVTHWLAPVHEVVPVTAGVPLPTQAYNSSLVYLDSTGSPVPVPAGCYDAACLAQHGVATVSGIYQPIGRAVMFQWMEVITYAVLTVVCAGVAWALVRRATR
jgi:ABC-type transport system involved in multi-copper enzyme maturation permease subunit